MNSTIFRSLLLSILFIQALLAVFASAGQKQIVFFDDFSNNKNQWAVENSQNATFSFQGGLYYFTHHRDKMSWRSFKTIGLDEHLDFEIETTIRKVGGITNNGYGLVWGRKDTENQFEFQVTGDGYIRIKKYENGNPHDFIGWKKTTAVRTGNGSTNKLRLEKSDHLVHFYVNDIHVHTMQFEPFKGHIIGYVIYADQQIAVDYLKISQSRPDHLRFVSATVSENRLFSDEFNNNLNSWPLKSSESAALGIGNGFYSFEHLKEKGWWGIFKSIQMDSHRDFEIETSIKKISGIQNNGYGLIWGRKDNENMFEYQIASNGYYKIKKRAGGKSTDIRPWTISGAINQGLGASNRINIVKKKRTIRFYINSVEVYAADFEPFMGDKFGYIIYQNQGIAVDYFYVSYLDDANFRDQGDLQYADAETDRGKGGKTAYGSVSPVPVVPVLPVDTAKGKRLALVVGNSEYVHGGSLKNPVNDARAMQDALESLGFVVYKHENCSQKKIKRAIDDFGEKLQGYDIGLFFYAGHGVQVDGANYLIPVDARLQLEKDVEYDCVRADRVLAKMEAAGSKTNIVILDACRDNPFERSWRRSGKGSGLAFMNAPSGSLIAYATSPGETAADGTGGNGMYTGALLKHIHTPGISILQMFQRVRSEVMTQTGNHQVPWESTSLRGDFYFK